MGQKRNRVAMSYLQRQTLTLVLNRFKTSAESWRSGESDNEAGQSLWEREGNYLSEMRTNQKRIGVPESSHVAGVCDCCTLIGLSIRASTLLIAPLLRFHYASRAYLRSSYVHAALPLRLWRSCLCPRCSSDAFNSFTMHSCYDPTSA